MFDYFVAAMKCPSCETVSPADASTNMQTHIRDDASGIEIGVGFQLDPLEVRDQDLESSGYLPVGRGHTVDHVQVLNPWVCPTCNHENWGRVTLVGTEVVAIESVPLDRAMLAGAQFIAQDCYVDAARVSGIAERDLLEGKINPVSVLLDRLS
jgi:hypothetical protein